jgi:hypothetical protein
MGTGLKLLRKGSAPYFGVDNDEHRNFVITGDF